MGGHLYSRQEGCVCDGLCIGRHFVVLGIGQVDVARVEWCEDPFDQVQLFIGRAVLYQYLHSTPVSGL